MLWLWLFVTYTAIQNCLSAAIVDFENTGNDEESRDRSGAFRSGDRDTGARIPHIMAEAGNPDVISAGQPLQEFLGLHQSDPQASSFKEKRCKTTDGYTYDLLGSIRSSLPALHLTRRDLQSETLKRRCELCKEGARCKKLGKCDLCTQICDKYAALDIQERDVHEDTVGITSRLGPTPDNSIPGLSDQEDRYYTVGTFSPGPIYDLLTKALGIHSENTIERFIVLAKAKTKGVGGKPSHPVVIDTAHIFSVNEGRPKELDFEVHEVAERTREDIDSLTSKVNSELDKTIEAKRKMQENPYLSPEEIDEVIKEVVMHVKEQPSVVGMASRNGEEEAMADNEGGEKETAGRPLEIVGVASGNNGEEERMAEEATVKIDGEDEEVTVTPSSSDWASTDGVKVNQAETEAPQGVKEQETQNPVVDDDSQSKESSESKEKQNDNGPRPRMNDEYQQQAAPNQFGPPQPEFQENIPQEQLSYIPDPTKAAYTSPKVYNPRPIIPPEEPEADFDNSGPIYVPDAHLNKPASSNFEEQYQDLRQWADDNVLGSSPPGTTYQQPRIPEGLLSRVNEMIDGAATSAKTLNEKIAKLVKTEVGKSSRPEEQIVKLDNMKEFSTSFSPEEQGEIMQTDPVVAVKNKDPRTESRYINGKWTSEKLPQSKPSYPSSRYQGRMSNLLGSQLEDQPRPFIDPKLLDMKSITQELKQVPGYVFQKAGEVVEAFRPKPDSLTISTAPPVAEMLSRSNAHQAVEDVACSHEESDEYYREAAEGKDAITEGPKRNEGQSEAETREAEEDAVGKEETSGEDVVKEDQNGNETVACSKEKDKDGYELMHVKPYDAYRSSVKEELSKLHLPITIDELIHPKAKADASRKSDGVKSKTKVSEMIEDLDGMHKHGHHVQQVNKDPEEVPFENPPNFGFNPPERHVQRFPMNPNPNFPEMDERPPPPPPQWQAKADDDDDDEMIGSPNLENRFQNRENHTNLGRIVPAASHHSPMHNRDVSDQMKPVFFLGDGINLPMSMKQDDDGSLQLSVDVKRLCKCKHCNRKQGRITDQGGENLGIIEEADLTMPSPLEAQGSFLEQSKVDLFGGEGRGKTEITKRSPSEKHDSGELVSVFGRSDEIFDDPISAERFSVGGRRGGVNLVKRKVGLVTDVLDWMKKVALDEAKANKKLK